MDTLCFVQVGCMRRQEEAAGLRDGLIDTLAQLKYPGGGPNPMSGPGSWRDGDSCQQHPSLVLNYFIHGYTFYTWATQGRSGSAG